MQMYTLHCRSRLHWAVLERDDVMEMWDTGHLQKGDGVEGPTASSEAVQEGIPLSLMSSRARALLGVGRPGGEVQTIYTLRADSIS